MSLELNNLSGSCVRLSRVSLTDTSMGRCRVGLFVANRGAGAMPFICDFSKFLKVIGALHFIKTLLVMAGIEQNPGPKDVFVYRYQYLLIEVGTTVLRNLFDNKVGNDFMRYLNANPTQSKQLKYLRNNNFLNAAQKKLLPPDDMKPTSSNFDITLLALLLRNVCGLLDRRDPVWNTPAPGDLSVEADITRLRCCRNNLMHSDTVVISETDFDDKWKELSGILIRLNKTSGITDLSALIDNARTMVIDEELEDRLDKTVKAWDSVDQDVMSKLDRGEKKCAAGHDSVMKSIKTVNQHVARVQQDMKQRLSTVQQEVKQVLSTLQQKVKQGQQDMKQELSSVQQDMKQELSSLQQDMKQGLSTVQQEVKQVLSTLQQKVKQGQQDMKQELSSVQQDMKQELSSVQQDMKQGLSTVQQDVKQGQQDLKQELSTVQQDMKQGQQDMKQGLSTVQQDVKQGQQDLKQELSSVQQDLKQELSTVQQDVKQGQQDLKQELSSVQQDVKQGQQDMKQGLSSVQQRLATVQEEIIKLKNSPTENAKVIQEKLMTIYQRDCRSLQVSPFIEDDSEDLISIYQSPTLHHTVNDSNQAKGKQETISSYEEIFCKDDKTFKRVYITGDAGVGKTSLCKRMCLLWSKSRSGDYAGNDESTKRDIKFLEKFDFLFHVSLGATDRRDMIMMIVDQLFYSECDDERTDMYKLIKRILNQHDSLIVLDGYDEWNPKTSGKHDCKTPEGIESEKCVFLTMCRPYKLENVRLSGSDIDHQIEISGIHGLSSEHYVTEVVKYMNEKTHDNKNAYQFLEEIKQCKLYDQLCIPMISSHLVVVWWSNQKLTHFSKAFLYGKILEMLFKRAERKFDFPSIPPSDLKLPKCFSQLDNVNEHVSLLQKVCLLSFNSLFKQDECASTLVFTKKQLMSQSYLFTSDEMDFLCKIGIISKNKVIGCFEDQKQILSFVHKSYIEFFSALYFSSFEACNMMDGVVKNWNSLDDVLQYQNFLQFLAGLSGQKLIVLLENIYSLLSDHLKLWRKYAIVNYKGLFTNSYREQLKLWQTTVINCFIECSRFIDPNVVLKLEDFIFDDNSSVDHLKQILLLNTTCVKSIRSVRGKYYDEFDQIQNLQCLHVGDVWTDYVYDVKFTECMLKNQSTLHTVCIEGRRTLTRTLIPELPVRSLQHLTSLSLSRVKMPHNSLHNLVTFLSDNVLIENIKLSRVYCDNHPKYDSACTLTLNLPHRTKLTSLDLCDVNILCNHVNNSSLKSITLGTFSESIVRCYIDIINCIKYSQLEHLFIDGSYRSDKNTMKALADTVYTLPYIKSLTLWCMELPDDVLLQLHPDVTQVEIKLWSVTLSRQCFHCFIESCVNNKSVIKVELHGCSIKSVDGETHSVLSREESVVYMSEYLTSIPTVNITDKSGTWLHFDTGSCQ